MISSSFFVGTWPYYALRHALPATKSRGLSLSIDVHRPFPAGFSSCRLLGTGSHQSNASTVDFPHGETILITSLREKEYRAVEHSPLGFGDGSGASQCVQIVKQYLVFQESLVAFTADFFVPP